MILSKVLSKHQITLPKEAVKALHVRTGDMLKCEIGRNQVLFKPVVIEEPYTEEELDKLEKLANDPRNKGKKFDNVSDALKHLHGLE